VIRAAQIDAGKANLRHCSDDLPAAVCHRLYPRVGPDVSTTPPAHERIGRYNRHIRCHGPFSTDATRRRGLQRRGLPKPPDRSGRIAADKVLGFSKESERFSQHGLRAGRADAQLQFPVALCSRNVAHR
jgi:hypothetical protein